jgi:S-DNA-T family DNA segregation ATPase FtsK/SpoIIIE
MRALRLPVLSQAQLDLLGLGLVALAVFLAFVFYLDFGGGRVGDALVSGFIYGLGAVAYGVPVLLFGAGALLVLGPLLPSVRPFRAGAACLVAALLIGLAGELFGLGPDAPVRAGAWEGPDFFRRHGGLVGEALHWVARTLLGGIGVHIVFLFLLLAGILLLTGASVASVLVATRSGVASTTLRVRQSTSDFAAVVARAPAHVATAGEPLPPRGRGRAAVLGPGGELEDPSGEQPDWSGGPATPPEVEPRVRAARPLRVVRATHVEAPAMDDGDGPREPPDGDPGAGVEPVDGAVGSGARGDDLTPEPPIGGEDGEGVPVVGATADQLTPRGHLRSHVTEADDFPYRLPSAALLKRSSAPARVDAGEERRAGLQLIEALGHFGVDAQVIGAVSGPHVTRYELRLAPGIKMSKVAQLKDDLAYALAATDVRILAPIPGKQAVGVEVPNLVRRMVHLGDVYQDAPEGWSPLTVWLGKDIAGKAIGTDLARQPHVLVAGTTGSGKSGCVNAMLSSILLRATPREVKLVLVDPKQVELNHYESVPHLLTPVVTSPRQAANVLANLIREMEQRYGVMSLARARNLVELNRIREGRGERPLPYILCVIDELADLMMVAPGEVEDAIIRLAQKSRAVGIHLLLATQRPSADIITGMIKANVPARIAFAVSSGTDSRVILDQNGAESLLGQGDMLFRPASESRTSRIQGAFIGEDEIERITDHWRRQGEPDLNPELLQAVESDEEEVPGDFDPDSDDLLGDAIATVVQMGTASTSMLQRRLRVGYTRAGRLIDMMERRGVISGFEGSKARQVLVSEADLPRALAALDEPVGASADDAA